MRRYKVRITTAADGSATAYTPRIAGKLHSIHYIADGANAYPNTVDITITSEATTEALLSRSNVSAGFVAYPRVATSAPDGTASLYADGGTAIRDKPALASDRIKIVLAQGGNAKVGDFHFLVEN
ncbi:MAG: hypothetical protein AB7P12_15255 [Alphaproteobacteria bacterium]